MTETTQEPLLVRCSDTTPRDRRNLRRFLWIFVVWGICFTAVSQALKRGLVPDGALPWLLATLPTLIGVFILAAYARYLRETDELQRLVNLEDLAIAFGGTILAASGYRIFMRLGAPTAELHHIVALMGLLFGLGTFVAWRRYR